MLKQYVAFMWDIDADSGLKGGWDHIVRAIDGRICSWTTKEGAIAETDIRGRTFAEDSSRIAEIKLQVVDRETGEVVWCNM